MSFSKIIIVGEYYCKKDEMYKFINYDIRFLDSCAMMNASLDSLVENLKEKHTDVNKFEAYLLIQVKHFQMIKTV